MVPQLSIQSRFAAFLALTLVAACSADGDDSPLGSGGSVATGGVSSGGVTATGGAPFAGAPGSSGTSSGGQFGSSGSAGAFHSGGSAGSLSGGAGTNAGGINAGGINAGGTNASGINAGGTNASGTNAGGTNAKGGNGGFSFGGRNQGGTFNTGGASSAGMAGGGRGPSGGSAGSATIGGSGGSGGDPFASASVCTSKMTWRNGESASMRPGEACIACHATNRGPDFSIAGTVYPTGHEPNDCNGKGNVTVVITDAKGTAHNLTANSVGNFTFTGTLPTPYTAKVTTSSGAVRAMTTPQTVGDCNSCHTEKGANSAPGRIVSP